MNKKYYLKSLAALGDVIKQLPDDVSICCIRDGYRDGETYMVMQILMRNDLAPDRIDNVHGWAEKDYDGVTVGWCLPEEDDE